ncbi:PhzF family phenazine biosynthesis protein [Tissierella creatinini]|nr:PhzF family phenazine biosynthesis protein [Tissierella creatinini]TJX61910.1 PhzF family phenazine biosynthesis protein [Soehngenia saccharolytica]
MEVNIFQVDAFSSGPFGGNPTVVVPNAKWISNEDKQKIANEMNVSYTTFVQQLGDERFRVNFYTPRQEVNFSGHGTIATFFAMAEMGYIKPLDKGIKTALMQTNNGRLIIEISYKYSKVDKVIMQLEGPDYIGSIKDIDYMLRALRVDQSQVGFEDMVLAPEIIYTGLPYIILGIKDKETLDKLDIDTCSLLDICKTHKATGLLAFYLPDKDSNLVYSRSFAPTMCMEEEPATGIASGALIYYLKKHKLIEKDSITSIQGHSLNRPSKIYCYIEEEGNKSRVKVGGNANIILEGILKY